MTEVTSDVGHARLDEHLARLRQVRDDAAAGADRRALAERGIQLIQIARHLGSECGKGAS